MFAQSSSPDAGCTRAVVINCDRAALMRADVRQLRHAFGKLSEAAREGSPIIPRQDLNCNHHHQWSIMFPPRPRYFDKRVSTLRDLVSERSNISVRATFQFMIIRTPVSIFNMVMVHIPASSRLIFSSYAQCKGRVRCGGSTLCIASEGDP